MERGTIMSYDKNIGMGMIGRLSDNEVKFYTESVIGRDRTAISMGDAVWFEVDSIQNLPVAINVRKV